MGSCKSPSRFAIDTLPTVSKLCRWSRSRELLVSEIPSNNSSNEVLLMRDSPSGDIIAPAPLPVRGTSSCISATFGTGFTSGADSFCESLRLIGGSSLVDEVDWAVFF